MLAGGGGTTQPLMAGLFFLSRVEGLQTNSPLRAGDPGLPCEAEREAVPGWSCLRMVSALSPVRGDPFFLRQALDGEASAPTPHAQKPGPGLLETKRGSSPVRIIRADLPGNPKPEVGGGGGLNEDPGESRHLHRTDSWARVSGLIQRSPVFLSAHLHTHIAADMRTSGMKILLWATVKPSPEDTVRGRGGTACPLLHPTPFSPFLFWPSPLHP